MQSNKRFGIEASLTALICIADQLIKKTVREQIPIGSTIFSIPGFVSLCHTENTGAAFSIFAGHARLLAVVGCVVLALICYLVFARFPLTKEAKVSTAVIVGGGLGNLIDRIRLGMVTDYIRVGFIRFPDFNLADTAVTMGVFALALLILIDRVFLDKDKV